MHSRPRKAGRCLAACRLPGAFTLVELLVVISIVSLLMALMLPALKNARTVSQATVSTLNAKQIVLSMHMYANDFKQSLPWSRFPPKSSAIPDTVNYSYWSGQLYHRGYMPSARIFWSPGRDTGWIDFTGLQQQIQHAHWVNTGFGINNTGAAVWHGATGGLARPPMKLSERGAPPPSKHLLITEQFAKADYPAKDGSQSIEVATTHSLFAYNKAVVRGYVDGHAIMREPGDMFWVINGDRDSYFSRTPSNRYCEPYYDFRWTAFWN